MRPPEVWIERLRHEKRSQSIGNDQANLILKSAHSGILPQESSKQQGFRLDSTSAEEDLPRFRPLDLPDAISPQRLLDQVHLLLQILEAGIAVEPVE